LTKQGVVELTLDGYSAPISAGNFAVNVLEGLYNNRWGFRVQGLGFRV